MSVVLHIAGAFLSAARLRCNSGIACCGNVSSCSVRMRCNASQGPLEIGKLRQVFHANSSGVDFDPSRLRRRRIVIKVRSLNVAMF